MHVSHCIAVFHLIRNNGKNSELETNNKNKFKSREADQTLYWLYKWRIVSDYIDSLLIAIVGENEHLNTKAKHAHYNFILQKSYYKVKEARAFMCVV